MKIHIIAAALPPKLDGIGDHTALLSAELAKSVTVTVLTGRGQTPAPIPGVRIVPAFAVDDPKSYRGLLPRIEADRPDLVLLQYNPFSYGRRGLNLHLPEVMRALTRRHSGTRFALMIHEPFMPLENLPFAVMTTWQRWQFWRLGRAADVVFCSIDPWAQRFRRWFPGTPVLHLPVGSNVPRVSITRAEARARLGIPEGTFVLGLFGAMHVSRMLPWVRDAAHAAHDAGGNTLVLYVGPHGAVVREAVGNFPLLADGPFPGEEVSRRLAAMDVHLTPFTDGVSTRRGSMMAGLQHGLATVGTLGVNSDDILRREDGCALLLAGVDDQDKFNVSVQSLALDMARREKLGQEAHRLYRSEFAWDVIAGHLRTALQAPPKKII